MQNENKNAMEIIGAVEEVQHLPDFWFDPIERAECNAQAEDNYYKRFHSNPTDDWLDEIFRDEETKMQWIGSIRYRQYT